MKSKILSKIERGRFYLTPSNILVKALRVDEKHNRVIFKSYKDFNNDFLDLDLAQEIWTPMFRIGEVASIVYRKPSTLRKYEQTGTTPKARQFNLNINGTKRVRLYSWKDILTVVEHVEMVRPPGRPSSTNVPAKLNREHIKTRLSRRFDKFNTDRI